MREHPILYNSAMVRAVLDDSKTQTRRVVKNPFESSEWTIKPALSPRYHAHTHDWWLPNATMPAADLKCPYGNVGDQLWVRETHGLKIRSISGTPHEEIAYLATDTDGIYAYEASGKHIPIKWKPSIHMPRKSSRIQLEITKVRVERLNDISEDDAMAEGCNDDYAEGDTLYWFDGLGVNKESGRLFAYNAKEAYSWLWESINGAGSWAANPWVWVIEFKVIKP